MELALYLAVAVVAAVGLLVIGVGIVGTPENIRLPSYRNTVKFSYPLAKRLLYPALAGIVVFAATRWLVGGVIAAIAAATYPVNAARAREQEKHVAKTEAIAAWIEQLRDAIVAGGGLETPLRRSAETGPELMRPQLRRLAVALDTHPTEDALQMFAHDVGHHLADMLAISYSIAVRESTKDLPELLGAIADSARDEVSTFQRVESSRRKIKSSTRMIIGIQAVIVGGAVLFGRDFLGAYDTLAGQMVLLACGLLVLGGQYWISRLSTVRRPPRFFAIEQDTGFADVGIDEHGHVKPAIL